LYLQNHAKTLHSIQAFIFYFLFMKTVLMVVANKGFQDFEYMVPRQILEKDGAIVTVASNEKGICTGALGEYTAEALYTISQVKAKDYDMVIFVGGPGAQAAFAWNPAYLQLAKDATKIGAICVAPSLISPSWVFQSKKVTGRDGGGVQIAMIENNGGTYVHQDVVTDGHIVTANGPHAAKDFGYACLDVLLSQ
jgi:protease I